MIHAYDELYLENAQSDLGTMLDYAVYDLNFDLTEFFSLFLNTGIASQFGSGDSSLIAGRSGVELAWITLEKCGLSCGYPDSTSTPDRSAEYWTGWALAYYQWESGISFKKINARIPVSDVRSMYHPYHEMDIRQFCDQMNFLYREAGKTTNLKKLREARGLSQRQLSEQAMVPLRSLQQYEQRQKKINHAQADTLRKLSCVLSCRIEDLMEDLDD